MNTPFNHFWITYSLCPITLCFMQDQVLDCHSKRSSKAYKSDENAMVDAITVGTDIHHIQGYFNWKIDSSAKVSADTKNRILQTRMRLPKDLRKRSVARAEISSVLGPS